MGYRDAIADPWGSGTPFGPSDPWPVRVDQYLAEGTGIDDVERWVRTASLHSNGTRWMSQCAATGSWGARPRGDLSGARTGP